MSKKIKKADILVIEATIHSLTMGYYIKMALDLDKPVILLHQPGNRPYYFSGIENERLQIIEYNLATIDDVFPTAIDYAKENLNIRFNLFITPELNDYLIWASKKLHLMRSSFVRNLIMDHKKLHLSEYEADLNK